MIADGNIETNNAMNVIWSNSRHELYKVDKSTIWTLRRNTNAKSSYFIELCEGEIKPRLVALCKSPRLYFNVSASIKDRDGYSCPDQSCWKIDRFN